jgi:hypothetical protein
MLGLLYKEFIISKRSLIMSLIIYLFSIAVVCLTLCISLFAANGETPEDWSASIVAMNGILTIILFGAMNSYYNNLFISDEKRVWANFSISLPTSVKGQVKAKYIYLFLINSIALFITSIPDAVIGYISGEFSGAGSLIGQMIFMFLIFKYSIEIPFTLRFGTKMGSYIMTAGYIVLSFGLIIYGLFGDISFFMENEFMDVFVKTIEFLTSDTASIIGLGIFSWVVLILYIVSYKISCKVYKKGVETYEQ